MAAPAQYPYPSQQAQQAHQPQSYAGLYSTQLQHQQQEQAVATRAQVRNQAPAFNPQAHLKSLGFTEQELVEARAEHARIQHGLCMSSDDLAENIAGHGIRMYFETLKYVGGVTFLVMVLQIVAYAVLSPTDFASSPDRPWYAGFFVSDFDDGDNNAWLWLNAICIIVSIFFAVVYPLYVMHRWGDKEKNAPPTEPTPANMASAVVNQFDTRVQTTGTDELLRLTKDGYIDVATRYRSAGELAVRRVLSALFFAAFIVAQVFITIGLSSLGEDGSILVSFAVSLAAVIVDLLYDTTATFLTEFEKHISNSSALRWLSLKLLLFKIANIMTVYGARRFASAPGQCVYDVIGEQFLTLWIIEMFGVNTLKLISSMVWSKHYQVYARLSGSIGSDEVSMPPFLISREYLKLMYNMFLTLASMVVFPLSAILGFVNLFFHYWLARFRLLKLCGRPLRVDHSERYVVSITLLVATLAGMLTPRAGAMFVLSGVTRDEVNTTCVLPLT